MKNEIIYAKRRRKCTALALLISMLCMLVGPYFSPFGLTAVDSVYAESATFTPSNSPTGLVYENGQEIADWTYTQNGSGNVAYCLEHGVPVPSASTVYQSVTLDPVTTSILRAAAYYGYPNNLTIGGVALTARDARAVTQIAIWVSRGMINRSTLTGNPAALAAIDAITSAAGSGVGSGSGAINTPAGNVMSAQPFGASYIRYGPFSFSNTTAARADISGATIPGAFLGDGGGGGADMSNLRNDAEYFYYIPAAANTAGRLTLNFSAQYSSFEVYVYDTPYAQAMMVCGGSGSAGIERSVALGGFEYAVISKGDVDQNTWKLSGAAFAVDQWSAGAGNWSATAASVTWDEATRIYRSGLLPETDDNGGRFRIRETGHPYSYLSAWSGELNSYGIYGVTTPLRAANTPVYVTVNGNKLDRDTAVATAQGDATLVGAVYGLYMNEDRTHPNGTVYTTGQLISEASTDPNGKLIFTKIFPAKYYLQEISPAEGYLLDPTKYEFDATHNGTDPAITVHRDMSEQVKKQAFELIKIGTDPEATETELLEAGFSVFLISALSKVKDGTLAPSDTDWASSDFKGYDFSGEIPARIDGIVTPELFTDPLGHLISPELPYGTYVVAETTTPIAYEPIYPFLVKITEDNRTPQSWRIFDDKKAQFYIKIIKKDAETGRTVLGKNAKFRIYDVDKGEYVRMKTSYPIAWYGTAENPFETGGDGVLITPEKLPYGHYELIEVAAPSGYVLAGHEQNDILNYNPDGNTVPDPRTPPILDFDSRTPVYVSELEDNVLEVIQYNEQQKGHINIAKIGERPAAVTADEYGNLIFPYTEEPLAGAVFEIIADGNISTQDGSADIVYYDGDIVITITTDTAGHAWARDLPIGDYLLREIDAPEGYLLVPDEKFSVTPIDQESQFSFMTYDLTDVRQKLSVIIEKTEEDSGYLLPGAEFKITSGGMTIITAVTGADGKVHFRDLPPGDYTIRETKAPDGYEINEDFAANVTLAYAGHETEYLTWTGTCTDHRKIISCEVDKDTIKRTAAAYVSLPGQEGYNHVGEADEKYRYDIDFRSTSSIFADEFVVDDPLENVRLNQVRLEELWTPVTWGDYDGKYNIWYKTSKTDDGKTYSSVSAMRTNPPNAGNPENTAVYPNTGYKLWAENLNTDERVHLSVQDLNLADDEYITALRYEFGRVEVGFTSKNYADLSLNGEHRTHTKNTLRLPSENADELRLLKNEIFTVIPGAEPPEYPGAKYYTGGITGNLVDWTPYESTPFFAQGALDAENLQPSSYLVSAVRPMANEDIVSSVSARIARDIDMRDMDQDAVVTRELVTFEYGETGPNAAIEGTFLSGVPGRIFRTGDDFEMFIWLVVMVLSVGAALVIFLNRRKEWRKV
ncbi:MAG: Cys-Gln thioester bond-forming surface protein [Clostridiales Family XIII bacterium]|jgi:TQXA domain-containing protein|nr:Cys-Gln thioester bond-forming surface protein [Clostridiales Family XIII bacterium]